MLRRLNIAPGQGIVIEGRAYVFTAEVVREGVAAGLGGPRDLSLRDPATGACLTLGSETFQHLYAAGEVRILKFHESRRDRAPADAGSPRVADAGEDEVARWRRLWCEAFDGEPVSRSDAALQGFIAANAEGVASERPPPSAGALRVWLRERGATGDRRARFMGDRRGEQSQPLRIDPLAARVLEEQAEVFYNGVRINSEAVYCATRTTLEETNGRRTGDGLPAVRPPSLSTVRRYLRRHLDYGRALRRYGWREGARRFTPIRGSMEARHVLDVAVVDQTLIDCVVVDDEYLINIGRPWLAVMIDVRSRYPRASRSASSRPACRPCWGASATRCGPSSIWRRPTPRSRASGRRSASRIPW